MTVLANVIIGTLFLLSLTRPVSAHDFILVVDPGHSAVAPGSVGCSGMLEYRANNAMVETLLAQLRGRPVEARTTRANEQNIQLAERVRDTVGADLFLSVHHDSVQPEDARVFSEGATPRVCSDKAQGFSIHLSRKNPQYGRSLKFARVMAAKLIAAGLKPNHYHGLPIKGENHAHLDSVLPIYAGDDLIVLKQARSPALLLEVGVIVNPSDEKQVTSAAFRESVAKAVADAVLEVGRGN